MAFRTHLLAALVATFWVAPVVAQSEIDVINSFNRGNDLKKAFRYDEADKEYQRCLQFALRVYGEDHKNTAQIFHALGDLYERQGKLEQAEAAYVRGLKVREKLYGPDHLVVADELAILASVSTERGKPETAEKLLTRALAIREKAKGDESKEVADTLNDLAILASRRAKFDDAESLYRKSLIIRQKTDGPNSAIVAQSLSNLGLALHDLNRYQDAEDCHRRALAIREKVKGADDPVTAESLNNLGILLRDLGRFLEAEELHRRALKIRETALGVDHARTASTVNNLAILCSDQGKYAEATGLFLRALGSYERTYGVDHAAVADAVSNLGHLEKQRGRLAEADQLYRQALSIAERVHGPNHEAVAAKLNHLAVLLDERGRYADAETLYRRALKIRETINGPEHELVAASLTSLATLISERGGRPTDARALFERAHRIREKVHGSEHPAVAEAANHLAIVLNKINDRKEAEALLKRNLDNVQKAFGKGHPAYADAMFNLAGCYVDADRFAEAEASYREALPLFEKFLGPGHPHVGDVHSHLGNCLRGQGKYEEALAHHRRAREIMQRAFGQDHPAVLASLNNQATGAWLDGKIKDAVALFDEQRRSVRRYQLRELPFRTEAEQQSFLTATEPDMLARALSLGRTKSKDELVARKSAEWLANCKATTLEARTIRNRLDRDITDSEARQALAEVIDLRAREAALGMQENGAAAANVRKQRTELWVRRRLLEQNLVSAGLNAPWVDLDAIAQSLPKDGLFVDIVRFRPARLVKKAGEPAWDASRYVAWLTSPAGEVTVVDLGEAEPIDAAVANAQQMIVSSAERSREIGETRAEQLARNALTALADLVVKPLTPHLKNVKTVIISPDGDLWLAPWAALPSHADRYLVESITPRLVISGRDLVRPAASTKSATSAALVIADPDYNAAPVASPPILAGTEATGTLGDFEATFIFGEAGKLTVRVPEGTIIGRGTWQQTGDSVRMDTERSQYVGKIVGRELRGQRRIKDKAGEPPDAFAIELANVPNARTLAGKLPRIPPQPLTRPEGESAAARLKSITGDEPRLLTDAMATETAVKTAVRPRTLVLGTYGYFMPAPRDGQRANDPLARSGIMLAGCNQRASAGPGQEDGVLTGSEVAALDLRGTEFVVLSTRGTSPDIASTGDSVAGLRQAFHLAGAGDVLTTLWPIPDSETGRLLGRFYDRLASGISRADALAAAQREAIQDRRKRNASSHPYYWASLTLTGR